MNCSSATWSLRQTQLQASGSLSDLALQLREAVDHLLVDLGRDPDQRGCVGALGGVAVDRVVAQVGGATDEPLHGPNALRSTHGLPPSHPTLPSMLRDAGYCTALVGKWHLGNEPHFGPLKSGYDEHFGLMSGGIDYFTHTAPNGKKDLWHNGTPVEDETYLTDLLSTRSVDFIQSSVAQNRPFFLSLHYTAPHWPWETREDHELAKTLVGKTFHLDGGSIETYQRMIHHMDEGIGKILSEVKRLGQDKNTLVIFNKNSHSI